MANADGPSISTPRYDFFQTATQVIVSFYVKGCRQEDVQIDVTANALALTIAEPSPSHRVQLTPLFGTVDTTNSGVRVLSTKVEVSLQKQFPGNQWYKLLGSTLQAPTTGTTDVKPTSVTQGSSSTAARPRSKWDSFKAEEEAGDDGDVDSFFKKLYADADDDTRRAMMKSYQESGGTTLSTNWQDVSKGKVETKPPDGMEARKWGK